MHELVFGTVATGEGAFHPGRDFTPDNAGDDPSDANASQHSQSVTPDTAVDSDEIGVSS